MGQSDEPEYDVRHDRVRYFMPRLTAADFAADPIAQFGHWLDNAAQTGVSEPNAMVIATASGRGQVRARTVLLRGYDAQGFVFFTNYESQKGSHLAENPEISACFSWIGSHRQVIIEGQAVRVSAAESDSYFASRPYESQVGSAASPQSTVISSLEEVEQEMHRLEQAHPGVVPRPDHWGGYRIAPRCIEFWQGNTGRLHDRFRYRRDNDSAGWTLERLAP